MIYFYAILALAIGVLLALKGLQSYRLLISLAVTAINASLYLSISDVQPDVISPLTAVIIALVSGAITYIFARIITYLWVYLFQMYFMIAMIIIFVNDPQSLGAGVMLALLLLVPLVGTILLRKHIKPILIGLMSGFSFGLGVATFITMSILNSVNLSDLDFSGLLSKMQIPLILLVLLIPAGVAFQYLFILKKNPDLAKI